MTLYFSPSGGGFFDSEIHKDRIPKDAVSVTPARHRKLLEDQAKGGRITPNPKDGRPSVKWPDKAERLTYLMKMIKLETRQRIEAVAPLWRQVNDLRAVDDPDVKQRFDQIDAIRHASNAIEEEALSLKAGEINDFAVSNHPSWPDYQTGND